jgi:hypothetical protein
MTYGTFANPKRPVCHRTDQLKGGIAHLLGRTGLINPQVVEMPRMRPAIKAGLMPKSWSRALMIDKPALETGVFSAFFWGKPSPVESWSIASFGFDKSS